MLVGRVDPPAFNLRNELMVAKHVHAAAITRLYQRARDPSRPDRERIETALGQALPPRVSAYLFEGEAVRSEPFDLSPLRKLIEHDLEDLVAYVEKAFSRNWPDADAEVTSPEALRGHVAGMVDQLENVIARLRRRLAWAMTQIRRLNVLREKRGALEPEDDALFRRCDRLVKRLKETRRRMRHEAEGYEDVYTFGVLAAEGFLPGYGLEIGSVLGTAEIPFWQSGVREFALPRPPSLALREYVPGNLVYANGHRFVPRRFHLNVDEERVDMPVFEVSTERQAVKGDRGRNGALRIGRRPFENHFGLRRGFGPPVAYFRRGGTPLSARSGRSRSGARPAQRGCRLRLGRAKPASQTRRSPAVGQCRRNFRHRELRPSWIPPVHGVRPERLPAFFECPTRPVRRLSRGALRKKMRAGRFLCRCGRGCPVAAGMRKPDDGFQRARGASLRRSPGSRHAHGRSADPGCRVRGPRRGRRPALGSDAWRIGPSLPDRGTFRRGGRRRAGSGGGLPFRLREFVRGLSSDLSQCLLS